MREDRSAAERRRLLEAVHADLDRCRRCPAMIPPVVHGGAVLSDVLLLGQAPGRHEGTYGRPFAWTAGKTLFRWLEGATGWSEATFRERVYMAAVARCFPGKAPGGGGDRKPAPDEIAACRPFLEREAHILRPALVIPVGVLAIEEVLKRKAPLAEVIGQTFRAPFFGRDVDVIPLPHPSGASPWPRIEPGRTLLAAALRLVAAHPAMQRRG